MSEREKARLSQPEPADADGDGIVSKAAGSMLLGLVLGTLIASSMAVSGALPEITTRIVFITASVLVLDRILGVSRNWIPRRLRRRLAADDSS